MKAPTGRRLVISVELDPLPEHGQAHATIATGRPTLVVPMVQPAPLSITRPTIPALPR
jgi:hypothetical protein